MSAALRVVAALLFGAALVLAACSGAGTTASSSPGTTAAAPVASGRNAMPLPAPTVAGTLAFARITSVHDGAHVIRTRDICLVRTDGTGLTPLSESVRLAWSPDGTAIAFAAGSDRTRTPSPRGSALYVVSADGSGLSVVPGTGKVWDPACQSR